ncbi:Serine/threonine-protein kinase PknD [Streptomyces badius]
MDQLGPDDPHRIGAYRLLGRLGEGGMGQVFLARSDRGRTVALKLVRRELAERPEFRARFRQEVHAAHRVGGAWTAPVLDSDTEAPVPWVATGYVAGPSLQRVVSGRPGAPVTASGAHGPLPARSVRLLGSGLAHALQHIHGAGLIHRDLKPSNVLMTIDGPRVIDFGIARALESVADGELTRTGVLVGSPGFMAPEQVRGERVTTACDVFCLGSVLAYAASGRLPFGTADSGGVHSLMFRIAQEDPDLTGVPEELADVVRDCLAKEPADRPGTDEILARLGEADADDPWLPATLLAQLGRQAVGLLDAEDPEDPEELEEPGATEGPRGRGRPGRADGLRASGSPAGARGPAHPGEPSDARAARAARAAHRPGTALAPPARAAPPAVRRPRPTPHRPGPLRRHASPGRPRTPLRRGHRRAHSRRRDRGDRGGRIGVRVHEGRRAGHDRLPRTLGLHRRGQRRQGAAGKRRRSRPRRVPRHLVRLHTGPTGHIHPYVDHPAGRRRRPGPRPHRRGAPRLRIHVSLRVQRPARRPPRRERPGSALAPPRCPPGARPPPAPPGSPPISLCSRTHLRRTTTGTGESLIWH